MSTEILDESWVYHELDSKDRKMNSNGYYEIYYPEHPRAVNGWILLHRCVMENFVGRYLNDEEVVHHVNENKTCNFIWNLFLCTQNEHTIIHRMGARHGTKTRDSMSKSHRKVAKNRKRGPGGRFASD